MDLTCPLATDWGTVADWVGIAIGAAAALATLLAVVVAIAVPAWLRWMDGRDEDKRRALRAEVAAIYFGPSLMGTHTNLIFARAAIARMPEMMRANTIEDIAKVLRINYTLPPIAELPSMGRQMAIAVAAAGASLVAWNDFVNDGAKLPKQNPGEHVYDYAKVMNPMLDELERALRNVAHAMEPFLPAPLELDTPEDFEPGKRRTFA